MKSGAHINSIGWMGPSGRELDDKLVRKARLVVDTIEGVLAESGDLLIPIRAGIISKNHIYAELEEVVSGKKPGRLHDDEITCFKSVGFAIGDAATAWCIYKRAVSGKVGTLIDF